jgi:hypothetical protein
MEASSGSALGDPIEGGGSALCGPGAHMDKLLQRGMHGVCSVWAGRT